MNGTRFSGKLQHQLAAGAKPGSQCADRTVEQQPPFVHHDQPRADLLDVLQVMGGEDDRGATLAVHAREELAHHILCHHVEADRRFVEEEDFWIMHERHGDFGTHALAEAQVTHRALQEGGKTHHLGEVRAITLEDRLRHAVHTPVQLETFKQRQFPPELRALAEDDADIARIGHPLRLRVATEHGHRSGTGRKDAGQHLDHRRFAGAIRTEITDRLARRDLEGDVFDRPDRFRDRGDEASDRTRQARLRHTLLECL